MRKPRTRYQQIASAVSFEKELNAKLIRVFRKYNKVHFTFQHNETKKKWTTTLSKLENYGHNKFKNKKKKNYWSHTEWKQAGDNSIYFDAYKVYVIRCTNKETKEDFYKIGRTFQLLENRFTKEFPYEYKLESVYTGDAKYICELEHWLHDFNKGRKYVPQLKFSGMYECFTSVQTHDGLFMFDGIHTFGGVRIDIYAD